MTPSEAYAALHEKHRELRPTLSNGNDIPLMLEYRNGHFGFRRWALVSYTEGECGIVHEDLALSACFVACVEACAKRGVEVCCDPSIGVTPFFIGDEPDYRHACVAVPPTNLHSIASVMDRVMQLPEVKK